MKWVLSLLVVGLVMQEMVCPPVQPQEGDSPEQDDLHEASEDETFANRVDTLVKRVLKNPSKLDVQLLGLEYDRYLREIVMALEEDEAFRKKLEETNMTDIKSGKIAMHLELVSHQIREKLDEIKRQEIQRLRMLARDRMKQKNAAHDPNFTNHVEVKNPHSFETKDLELLIKKATNDLDEIDKKRRGEFKEYEMEKEFERRQELEKLDEDHKKIKEEEYERMEQKHKEHPKVHHPGSKAQLEEVWDKKDHMDADTFEPKTFFKLHDLDGDQMLDQEEIEALFQQELDQVYDPNLPEDDMRERYEDMARMREHVFSELDKDKDRMITLDEFLNYTASQDFEKDEGWKTVDEEEQYTEEEYKQYEQMMREHEERMRMEGHDPNLQPGVVPVGNDPAVQMQIPHDQPQMGNIADVQNPRQMHGQGQMPVHGQGQMPVRGQGQMPGQGQVPMHAQGQMPMHGQGQMPMHGQGQMPGQGQMGGGPPMGQGMPPGQMPVGQENNMHVASVGGDQNNAQQAQAEGDNVQGQGVNVQGQGVNVQQGQGVNVQQGQGVNEQQGQGVNEQQGQGVNEQQGQGVNEQQGQGQNMQQGHGSNIPQGESQGTDLQKDQAQGANVAQGGAVNVQLGQGQGENVQQGQGHQPSLGNNQAAEPVQVHGQPAVHEGEGDKIVVQAPPQGQPAGQSQGLADGGMPPGQGPPQGVPVGQGHQQQGQPLKFEGQQQHQQQQQQAQKPLV